MIIHDLWKHLINSFLQLLSCHAGIFWQIMQQQPEDLFGHGIDLPVRQKMQELFLLLQKFPSHFK